MTFTNLIAFLEDSPLADSIREGDTLFPVIESVHVVAISLVIGSILVQTQYYMLDKATQRLFGLATNLTEVFVVSVLERRADGQLR